MPHPSFIHQRDHLQAACEMFDKNSKDPTKRTVALICDELQRGFENEEKQQEEIEALKAEVQGLKEQLQSGITTPKSSYQESVNFDEAVKQLEEALDLPNRQKQLESKIQQLNQTIREKEDELISWGNTASQKFNTLEKQFKLLLGELQQNIPSASDTLISTQSMSAPYHAVDQITDHIIQLHNATFQVLNRTIARLESHIKSQKDEYIQLKERIDNSGQTQPSDPETNALEAFEAQLETSYRIKNNQLNQLEVARFNTINQTLLDLESRVKHNEKIYTECQTNITQLNQKTQALEKNNTEEQARLHSQLKEMEKTITQLKANISQFNHTVIDIKATSFSALERRIHYLEDQKKDQSQTTDHSLRMRLSGQSRDIAQLERIKDAWAGDFSNIEKQVKQVSSQYTELNNTIKACQTAIKTLKERVDVHETRLNTHESKLNQLEQKASRSLKGSCAQHNLKLKQLTIGHLLCDAPAAETQSQCRVFYTENYNNDVSLAQEVQTLIEAGAEVNQRGGLCQASLLYAVVKRNLTKTAKVFLEHHADITINTQATELCVEGQNTACETNWRSNTAMLECLLSTALRQAQEEDHCLQTLLTQPAVWGNSRNLIEQQRLLRWIAMHSTTPVPNFSPIDPVKYQVIKDAYFEAQDKTNIDYLSISSAFIKKAFETPPKSGLGSLYHKDLLSFMTTEIAAGSKPEDEYLRVLLREEVLRQDPRLLARALEGPTPCIAGRTSAHEAVINNNTELLEALHNADNSLIHVGDIQGRNLVHIAALHNRTEIMEWLIEQGVSAVLKDAYQATPIELAVYVLNNNTINALVKHGISRPTVLHHNDITPLVDPLIQQANLTLAPTRAHFSLFNCEDTFDVFLKLQAQFPGEKYPVHAAIEKNDEAGAIAYLKTRCADINWQDTEDRSLLYVAVLQRNSPSKVVDTLFEKWVDATQQVMAITPFFKAVQLNRIDLVRTFIAWHQKGHFIGFNTANQYGATPLYEAVLFNHREIVEALLQAGANMSLATHYGNTPLHAAVYKCHSDIVSLLLKYRAPIFAKNSEGVQPFWFKPCSSPIRIECVTVVQQLLNACQTQFKDWFNFNFYYGNSHTECWQSLESNIYKAASYLAAISCDDTRDFLIRLKDSGKGYYPIHKAAETGDIDTVTQYLNTACAEVNWQDLKGRSLIYQAIISDQIDIMQKLYNQGSNMSIIDNEEYSPLQRAANNAQSKTVNQIIRLARKNSNIDLNQESFKIPTALYLASDKGYLDIVQSLVDAGANVSRCTQQANWCPIHAAIQHCNTDVVKVLLRSDSSFLSMLTRDKVQNILAMEGLPTKDECYIQVLECIKHITVPCSWDLFDVLIDWCKNTIPHKYLEQNRHFEYSSNHRHCTDLIKQHEIELRNKYYAQHARTQLPQAADLQREKHPSNITVRNQTRTPKAASITHAKSPECSVISIASHLSTGPCVLGFVGGLTEGGLERWIKPIALSQYPYFILVSRLWLRGVAYTLSFTGETGLAVSCLFIMTRWGMSQKEMWMQAQLGEQKFNRLQRVLAFFENIYIYEPITCLSLLWRSLSVEVANEMAFTVMTQYVLQCGVMPMVHQVGHTLGDGLVRYAIPEAQTVKKGVVSFVQACKTAANFSYQGFSFFKQAVVAVVSYVPCVEKEAISDIEMQAPEQCTPFLFSTFD